MWMQAQVALEDTTGDKHCHSFGLRFKKKKKKSDPILTYTQTWAILNVALGLSELWKHKNGKTTRTRMSA